MNVSLSCSVCVCPIFFRAINYDEKDPFLCNACGYCKYAKFDYTLQCRPCCAVDPIENEDDRKKAVLNINALLEKADRSYKQLQAYKPTLEVGYKNFLVHPSIHTFWKVQFISVYFYTLQYFTYTQFSIKLICSFVILATALSSLRDTTQSPCYSHPRPFCFPHILLVTAQVSLPYNITLVPIHFEEVK